MRLIDVDALKKEVANRDCDTCKWDWLSWDNPICEGCSTGESHWERKDHDD